MIPIFTWFNRNFKLFNLFKMSSENGSNNDQENQTTPPKHIPGTRQEMYYLIIKCYNFLLLITT